MQRWVLSALLAVAVGFLGCGESTENPAGVAATEGLTITQPVFPTDGAQDVPVNTALLLHFRSDVTPASAEASIALSPPVDGVASYDLKTATVLFQPRSALSAGTTYEVTVQGVGTHTGAVVEPYTYRFTAGGIDSTGPSVQLTEPADQDTTVDRSAKNRVIVHFNESVNPVSFAESLQIDPEPAASVNTWRTKWSTDGTTVELELHELGRMQTYLVTLDSQRLMDLAGNHPARDIEFQFTTEVGADVEEINPNGSAGVRDIWSISRIGNGKWRIAWPVKGGHWSHTGEGAVKVIGGHITSIRYTPKADYEGIGAYVDQSKRNLTVIADIYHFANNITFTTDAEKVVFENFTYKGARVDKSEIWIGRKGAHPSSSKSFTLINSDLPTLR